MRATKNDDLVITTKDDGLGNQVPLHFPVQLVKATEDKNVKWDTAAPSGGESKVKNFDGSTGETFEREETLKGVRIGDTFHEVPKESIDAIDKMTTLTDMRVETVMPYEDVDFSRATDLYYLQVPPKSGAHKVYHLIYRALLPQKGKTKADKQRLSMRVKFSIRSRQKAGVIYADAEREVLVMNVLAYADTIRQPDEALLAHKAAQVEQAQIDKARELLVSMVGKDTNEPFDEAIALKQELMEKAFEGEGIEAPAVPEAEAVPTDNLDALLDASLV